MSTWTICPVCGAIIGDPDTHILYHEVVMPQVIEEMTAATERPTAADTTTPGEPDANH